MLEGLLELIRRGLAEGLEQAHHRIGGGGQTKRLALRGHVLDGLAFHSSSCIVRLALYNVPLAPAGVCLREELNRWPINRMQRTSSPTPRTTTRTQVPPPPVARPPAWTMT